MKAITIWPEWVWAIFFLDKRVENRSWRPPDSLIGQRIALHAGKYVGGRTGVKNMLHGIDDVYWMARKAKWDVWSSESSLHFKNMLSGQVAEMYLSGPCDSDAAKPIVKGSIIGTAVLGSATFGDDVMWSGPEMCHWHLKDLKLLSEPILTRGWQKFWEVSDEHLEQIRKMGGLGEV